VGFYSGNSIAIGDENATVGDINVFNTAAGTTRRELDQFNVGNASGLFPGLSNTDLNFFDDTSGGYDMFFFDDKTAVTGTSLVLDPTGVDGPLPTVGMSGDVYAGGLASSNIIGQYRVVPEPSTAALTALGLIGLASRRRRP
jgi:hypothetical protein